MGKVRDELSILFDAQREQQVQELRDLDACIELWRTVIERAIMDLEYLRRHEGRKGLKKHELEKLRRIRENPPAEFIKGPWFEAICEYLQIDAERMRRQLTDLLEAA